MQATIGYCVPLLSYGCDIVDWTKAELSHFDVLAHWIIMTTANSHDPHSVT